MLKKMMLLALSVGALVAFMAPAAAQAEVYLYEEGSGALGSGADVTATSSNLKTTLTPSHRVLECEQVTLHLEVGTNGLNHVTLTQIGAATTANCVLNFGGGFTLPATITDGTLGFEEGSEITINTWGTANSNSHFAADVNGGTCELTGSVHVTGTNGTDILHVGSSLLTGSTGCENGDIAGTFTLETESGTPVYLHSVET